jgi:hypothetical protein
MSDSLQIRVVGQKVCTPKTPMPFDADVQERHRWRHPDAEGELRIGVGAAGITKRKVFSCPHCRQRWTVDVSGRG